MGHSNDRRWWIVSLDMFVQATSVGGAAGKSEMYILQNIYAYLKSTLITEDVDITLTEIQKQHLRVNAQKQLVPPIPLEENTQELSPTNTTYNTNTASKSLFFPLVNLYDYLHLCSLNMQLEILFIQSAMLAKTRWITQLKVQMNQDRTKLTLTYWRGGSPASQWARPHLQSSGPKSTILEISVSDEHDKHLTKNNLDVTVRDELKGLIQKAGIGASVALSSLSAAEKPKVLSSLKYPKNSLEVLWDDCDDLHTNVKLLVCY